MVLRIRPTVDRRSWGIRGARSRIYQLLKESPFPELAPDDNEPFAELWYSTHPRSPAYAAKYQDSASPEDVLWVPLNEALRGELPYLLKLLSVRTALSIQAHPDSTRARILNARDPKNYPDPFPKPECGFALTRLELLHGFRSPEEIARLAPPELSLIVPGALSVLRESGVRGLFESVSRAPESAVQSASKALYERIRTSGASSPEEEWIAILEDEYPDGDVGLFSFYIMNLEQLEAGELIYIAPNVPHAYLRGELIELMAPSDNVVRAGLTPRFRDVETLLEMTDYSAGLANRLAPEPLSPGVQRFPFADLSLTVFSGSGACTLPLKGVVTALLLSGSAKLNSRKIEPGEAIVFSAHEPCTMSWESAEVFLAATA